jgi:hypothetical protein
MKKIRQIKFYQGVLLDGNDVMMSFTPDENFSDAAQRKGRKAELQQFGVMLISPTRETLVPWNNVAYVQYLVEPEVKKVEPKSVEPKPADAKPLPNVAKK